VDFTLKSRDEVKASSRPTSAATVFAQNVPEFARAAYEQAIENLDKKNDAEQGIADLKKAIGLFPTYYLALERLGAEYLRLQQYESAVQTLNKAIGVNPKGPSSFYARGVAQYYLKQMPEAIKSLRYSMSLAPDSPNAAFLEMYLGMALLKSGKTEEAETHLRQAHVKGGKLLPDVHMHLAQIYSNGKRYKDAADELELFLTEIPDARDAERIKEIIKQLRAKAN
jgi:tetratricopeptide (TPR) repeat protein